MKRSKIWQCTGISGKFTLFEKNQCMKQKKAASKKSSCMKFVGFYNILPPFQKKNSILTLAFNFTKLLTVLNCKKKITR